MDTIRRVASLGLLGAHDNSKEEDALNLALALSLSEEEQRKKEDVYNALLYNPPVYEVVDGLDIREECKQTCTTPSTAGQWSLLSPNSQRREIVEALPEKLRLSLKQALEEDATEPGDVNEENIPTVGLDLQDAAHLRSPRVLSIGTDFDEKMKRIASAFDLSSQSSSFSPRVNVEEQPQNESATAKDLRRLHRRLNKFTLTEYTIRRDGNCQFASLSDQLYRTPKMQGFVRKLVVKQLLDYPDYYSRFVPGDYKFYCWKMSQNHVWGDHLTLQAAADCYGIQISLITSYKNAPYMTIMPREIKSCRILWLSFHGELHYNSLYTHEDIALRRQMDEQTTASCTLF